MRVFFGVLFVHMEKLYTRKDTLLPRTFSLPAARTHSDSYPVGFVVLLFSAVDSERTGMNTKHEIINTNGPPVGDGLGWTTLSNTEYAADRKDIGATTPQGAGSG